MSIYYRPIVWRAKGTKGRHSSQPPSSDMPVRRQAPIMAVPRHHTYSAPSHDFGIEQSLNRADFLSSATLEDTYDAASRSRNKDKDLLRNVNSAIQRPSRDTTPIHRHRFTTSSLTSPSKRFHSLPPSDHHNRYTSMSSRATPSPSSSAVMPYRHHSVAKTRATSYLEDLPSPSSLLSSKIDGILKDSATRQSRAPSVLSTSWSSSALAPRQDFTGSSSSYKHLKLDPEVERLLKKPTGYTPGSLMEKYLSLPPPISRREAVGTEEDDADDEDGYVPYKRRYQIVKSPAITYRGDDESDEEGDDNYQSYGTYSCPRPPNTSYLKLSSYDGNYDGSYEADMAEMYEYVPFGPSKHGIFELTQNEVEDNDINPLPPPLTSTYPTALEPTSVSLLPSPLPTPAPLSTTTSVIPISDATSPVLDSLVSNAAARARRILQDSKSGLPEYKDASLVLSVEGSAVSEDGKNRYGFRYYPPPVTLKGSNVGLDERILGISPLRSGTSPVDSFLHGYLQRLRSINTESREPLDRGEYARGRSVTPSLYLPTSHYSPSYTSHYRSRYSPSRASSERCTSPYASASPPSVSLASLPSASYSHRTINLPVHLSDRATSVPVSSYRARQPSGLSHRVDVFPLVESETRLPAGRRMQLPIGSGTSPEKLTMLEKINIKVSTELHESPRSAVVSRRVRAGSAPPVSRPPPGYQAHAQMIKGTLQPKKPWYIERAERAQSVARERSVPPRSLRGASVPPQESPQSRRARAMSVPPPQPLPTANLRSSRRVLLVPRGLLLARARSLERSDEAGPNVPQSRARMIRTPIASHPSLSTSATQHLWAHRPMFLSKDRVLAARARSDPRNPYGARLRRASSEPRMLDRAEQSHHSYYIPDLPQSYRYYHRVPDAGERALTRHVYAHRGRYGPQAKPPRPSLVNFPQVYVPWYGPGPSNRSKAAIIGSKMEPEGRSSRRGPRSQFAQDKMREIRLDDLQESVFARAPSTSALHASAPPLPKPTDRKAIRDLDGFTKPKNVLSWEYRIESRLNPSDYIYEPSSLLRMRERVKDVQYKMDRQRQMLDRYLDKELPPTITSSRTEGGVSAPVKIPAYYAAGGDPNNMPMSDLRRRLRRTLAMSRNNPDYFKE